jgi:hypothetical protein
MENLSFQYPGWYLLLCIALGVAYAATLYFRVQTFSEYKPVLRWGLSLLRFLAGTILAILLLQPLLTTVQSDRKNPVIVLAQDHSESIKASMSEAPLNAYRNEWKDLQELLGSKYEVVELAFGEKIRQEVNFEFNDKVTNISNLVTEVLDLYGAQNLGALVLATDGIYNEGSNPLYSGTKLSVPVYAIALGDTAQKKDLILKRVFHNKIAYLGDRLSIQTDVGAINCAGNKTTLTVSKIEGSSSRILHSVSIPLNSNDFFSTQEFVIDASESGVQRYRISLSSVNGETTQANNSKDFYLDVLDARQKVLLLANSPHPDLAALKQTLEINRNYDVSISYINALKVNVADYDFVVLHNLPSNLNDIAQVMNQLNNRKIARMFIVGTQTNLTRFNQVQSILNIQGNVSNPNDVQGTLNPGFSLFTLDDELRKNLPLFNPLSAPFGEFTTSGNSQVLLFQRIGKVDTKYPLLLFGQEGDVKVAVLAAEGLWRWKLFDYLQHKNHNIFSELIGKKIQYTSLKTDKRRFRISLPRNIFSENESVFFDAELYNESYELVNDPDVSLTITNNEGRDFNYTFDKKEKSYSLNPGVFPVGDYKFKGKVVYNGQNLTYEGQFSVQPVQLELYETTANHSMLKRLSQDYGGEMYYPGQLKNLGEVLLEKEIKPIIYNTNLTQSVINLKWIFFLLLAMLSLEWFLRRYYGAY